MVTESGCLIVLQGLTAQYRGSGSSRSTLNYREPPRRWVGSVPICSKTLIVRKSKATRLAAGALTLSMNADHFELNGALCGLICAHPEKEENPVTILTPLIDELELDARARASLLVEVETVANQLTVELRDGTFAIESALDDEDSRISERAGALVAWCSGFLHGLALAEQPRVSRLSDEAREVLKDFSEFSKMSVAIVPSEDAESDLMELTEYVRVGAMLLYEELRPSSDTLQ